MAKSKKYRKKKIKRIQSIHKQNIFETRIRKVIKIKKLKPVNIQKTENEIILKPNTSTKKCEKIEKIEILKLNVPRKQRVIGWTANAFLSIILTLLVKFIFESIYSSEFKNYGIVLSQLDIMLSHTADTIRNYLFYKIIIKSLIILLISTIINSIIQILLLIFKSTTFGGLIAGYKFQQVGSKKQKLPIIKIIIFSSITSFINAITLTIFWLIDIYLIEKIVKNKYKNGMFWEVFAGVEKVKK